MHINSRRNVSFFAIFKFKNKFNNYILNCKANTILI